MVVAVDEIEVYDHNPRQLANDKYEEIKASIRASGMDQTLTITRRPGAPRYMIAAGGNTRLQAVKALWKETGDERFDSIHCLYRPWAGDTDTLVAHLKENDVRGDLSFIDRARGLSQLQAMVEADRGSSLSQRESLSFLGKQGYGVSHPVLVSVNYAIQSLEHAIPTALTAGMSRAHADRIRKLHRAFVVAWSSLNIPDTESGQSLFIDLLSRHDDDVINLDLLHRDGVNELSVSADCDLQHAAMTYGAAIDGRDLDHLVERIDGGLRTDESEEKEEADLPPPPASQSQSAISSNAPQHTVPEERPVATSHRLPQHQGHNRHRPPDLSPTRSKSCAMRRFVSPISRRKCSAVTT
jgi:ParB family protein of integrating conjugative element (PFGI_1 class)